MIGKIEKIIRYPVKSMMGESLNKALVQYKGLQGDRVYAFVDEDKNDHFPWLTARQFKKLPLYQPKWNKLIPQNDPYPKSIDFDVSVTTPDGLIWNIHSFELLDELQNKSKRNLSLRFSEAGMQDARPVSLISYQTLKNVQDQSNIKIADEQLRMNFYVNWLNNEPFYEEQLLGKKIQIGQQVVLEINKKDARCAIINIDPSTGQVKPETLRYIAQELKGCLGVYAIVVREGLIEQGDEIRLFT